MDTDDTSRLTMTAGSLTIGVWYDGVEHTHHLGRRHRWAYRLQDSSNPTWEPVRGADLYLSPVAPNTPEEAMRSLLSFLTAAGEAYHHTMRHPNDLPENLDLFPDWVPEAAYLNADELGLLPLELDGGEPGPAHGDGLAGGEIDPAARPDVSERLAPRPERAVDPELAYALEHDVDGPEATWPPATFYDVVFLQGEEGHAVVDLIEEQGVDAAIEHLSAWDYGTETMHTALFHGHVYDEAPSSPGDHAVESGPYVLAWHAGLGHVNLLRRFDQADEQPARWPDRTARLSPVAPKDVDPEPPARRSVDRLGGPGL